MYINSTMSRNFSRTNVILLFSFLDILYFQQNTNTKKNIFVTRIFEKLMVYLLNLYHRNIKDFDIFGSVRSSRRHIVFLSVRPSIAKCYQGLSILNLHLSCSQVSFRLCLLSVTVSRLFRLSFPTFSAYFVGQT